MLNLKPTKHRRVGFFLLLPGGAELFDELSSSRSSSTDTSALASAAACPSGADSPFISSCAAPAAPGAFFCFRLTFDFSFNFTLFLPERTN